MKFETSRTFGPAYRQLNEGRLGVSYPSTPRLPLYLVDVISTG